jgi:hypothetical protein
MENNTEDNMEDDLENCNNYELLYNNFKQNYTMSELLSLCEKHKLSIYGSKEIVMDRLAFYFSNSNKEKSFNYKIKECFNSIIKKLKINRNDYKEIS